MAAAIAKDTMDKMYQVTDGNGHFNVIFPLPENSTGIGPASSLTSYEMRHVVDVSLQSTTILQSTVQTAAS